MKCGIILLLTVAFLLLFEPSACQGGSGRVSRGTAGGGKEGLDAVSKIVREHGWVFAFGPLAFLLACLGCACCKAIMSSSRSGSRQPGSKRYKRSSPNCQHPESSAVLMSTSEAGLAVGEQSHSRFGSECTAHPANISPNRPSQQIQPYGYQPTNQGLFCSFSSVSGSASVPHSSQSQSTSQSYLTSSASEGQGSTFSSGGLASKPNQPSAPSLLEVQEYLDIPPPAYHEIN